MSEPTAPAEKTLVEKAAAAWQERADRAQLERAIEMWNQALEERPGDVEILTQLSEAFFFLADSFLRDPTDLAEMTAAFENGILAAENAMISASADFANRMKNGDQIEVAVRSLPAAAQPAVYWYSVNLGQFALAKGFPVVLFYKDRMFAVMQWVLSIDETVFYAAPHRFFGAFLAKSPNFAGGDMKKAKQHFERALELFPDFLATKVIYAEYFAAAARDRELFVRLLTEVTNADPTVMPAVVPEQRLEQAKAERLLAQVDQLF